MQENLSALMDGELDERAAARLLTELKQSEELRQHWHTYHLIGDVLRGESAGSTDLLEAVSQKLASEPVILAPRSGLQTRRHVRLAYSLAASVAGFAFVAWLGWSSLGDNTVTNNNQQAMNSADASRMRVYWQAHRQFAGHMDAGADVRFASVEIHDGEQ